MRLLRAADRVPVPWKNGGGVTREVAAFPEGAGFDDFLWRVSMAEVRADGPFSVFPGVDRVLAVLEGRLRLEVEGLPPVELSPESPPAVFPGDAPTHGAVLDGPVLDLNVMTRRGRAHADVRRLEAGSVATGGGLLVATEPARAAGVPLARYDVLVLEPADKPPVLDSGRAWLVSLGPEQIS
ncbi:HutD family protein [Phenylobacterium sp.]|uniref:HutD/Ves family protein n=1 Tax=Phenylobacterium sp. TaxID=1871053 RepID=UPI002C2A6E3E|nr:HutD family protein [Phenylobacterium sp.]HVI33994.1 HutD family protein [Phenylobacterium sp.]